MKSSLVKSFRDKLGPGLLFAATAVGVSHVVQSTRAGGTYGLSFAAMLIVLSCLIKYPVFRFGSEYAAITGKNLIDAYERQGRWVMLLYAFSLPLDMFIVPAAISLVTAGILKNTFDLSIPDVWVSFLIMATCAGLLISGRYHLFENLTKFFVIVFSVLIVTAAVLAVPELEWSKNVAVPTVEFDQSTLLFMIAIAGWMPTGVSVSVYQSLWVCEKSKLLQRPVTRDEANFDFNMGYLGSLILAICFALLGAGLMFNSGIAFSESASGFAAQLISLFTQVIGDWAYPLIALGALAAMASTVPASLDACPRALRSILQRLDLTMGLSQSSLYNLFVVLMVCGSTIMLVLFLKSFKTFIDFATSVVFVSAPLLAFFNHRAMVSDEIPEECRPGKVLRLWSIGGIIIMLIVALYYLYSKLL